ncbi:MAG: TIGR03619 family F420-dependent LLM class oxidoreductase [Microthrixaceae bacterium]
MAGIIGEGQQLRGIQLPIQSKSPTFVQPWEKDATAADLGRIARAADESRLGYVAVCDHVAVPAAANMSSVWYDTVATLGWLAGQCPNVWLLSHVYVVGYRHPLQSAKSFATLDALSGGRVIMGVGAGHLEGEFRALGADFGGRGAALEEAIAAIRSVFASDPAGPDEPVDAAAAVTLDGERWAAPDVRVAPRPARPGGPPIWVGGSSPAAIRRAAQLGDGWLPQGPPKDGLRPGLERLRRLRDEAGLADVAFDVGVNCEPIRLGTPMDGQPSFVLGGPPDRVAERLARYERYGINQLQLSFLATSVEDYCDQLARFGADVAPLLPPQPATIPEPE